MPSPSRFARSLRGILLTTLTLALYAKAGQAQVLGVAHQLFFGAAFEITSISSTSPLMHLPAFDTSFMFVPRAADFVKCRIPVNWGFVTTGGDSTSRFDWAHVGAIFVPGGYHGYNRWMAGTPIDSVTHEVPCVRASNDGINWVVPSSGGTTCRDPLFTRDSCKHNGTRATYLSDTDLLLGKDGRIWIMWRATHDMPDSTYHSLWVTSTTDGVHWSGARNILGWFSEGSGGPKLSPAFWVDHNGNYRMWVVQTNPSIPDSNIIELWQAPQPDSGWMLVDTVKKVGSSANWVGAGDISVGGAWHVEVVDHTPLEKIVLLVNRYAATRIYRRLYIGVTPDDGLSLDMKYDPLLMPADTTADATGPWDARLLYRSTAYWVTNGTDSTLEFLYVGNAPAATGTGGYAGHWRLGLTRIDKATRIDIKVDSFSLHPGDLGTIPIWIMNPQDTLVGLCMRIRTDRPDMIRFDTTLDTAGTLLGNWGQIRDSVSPDGSLMKIRAKCGALIPELSAAIMPWDVPRRLVKVRFEALHIPDTMTDRIVHITVDSRYKLMYFEQPAGNPVAGQYRIVSDTLCYQCTQWDGNGCVNWSLGAWPTCDSVVINTDSLVDMDSTILEFEAGAVTLLACSYAPVLTDINNDGSGFTLEDRTELFRYVTKQITTLPEPRNADLDGDCLIGWSDLYRYDSLLLYGVQSIRLPLCSCESPTWSCCWGKRGNINNDARQVVDLSDLSMLIGYLTAGSPVGCAAEANINGADRIDLSDLSGLISYLLSGAKTALSPCP